MYFHKHSQKEGYWGNSSEKFLRIFLGKTSETSSIFTTDLIKFLKKDIFFLLQTSSIFSTDLKKDIFFLLLDPRLSVKEWVGV